MEQNSGTAAVVDLSGSVYVDTHALVLNLPGTSKPCGWTVHLAGPSHPQSIDLSGDISREIMEREKAIEFAQVNGRKWKGDDETPKQRRRANVERVCRRIIGWSPDPVFKHIAPEPIAFSLKAATDLFLRPEIGGYFVQITDYLNGEKAFIPPSGQT